MSPPEPVPRRVPEPLDQLPGAVLVHSRGGQVPGRQVEDRLVDRVGLAVHAAAAGAGAGAAVVRDEILRRRRRVRLAGRPVVVAEAGAGQAGVAVAGADPPSMNSPVRSRTPGKRAWPPRRRRPRRCCPSRRRRSRRAVAPLVDEDALDLAGVGAVGPAGAGTVDVDALGPVAARCKSGSSSCEP